MKRNKEFPLEAKLINMSENLEKSTGSFFCGPCLDICYQKLFGTVNENSWRGSKYVWAVYWHIKEKKNLRVSWPRACLNPGAPTSFYALLRLSFTDYILKLPRMVAK